MCVGERLKRASVGGPANTGVLLPLRMHVSMSAYAISFSRRHLAENVSSCHTTICAASHRALMHGGSLLLPWGPKPVNDAGAPEAPQMANLTIVFSTQPLGANCHSMAPPCSVLLFTLILTNSNPVWKHSQNSDRALPFTSPPSFCFFG